jgi:hypothetical protein
VSPHALFVLQGEGILGNPSFAKMESSSSISCSVARKPTLR